MDFITVEVALIALYILCLIHILRKDKKMLPFFISSTFYAVLFENMNILLSYNNVGGYYYNSSFRFFIFHVPLFVVLAWSIIIYTSFKIASSLGLKKNSIPFTAALLVLLIDLAIDVIAIRLNYWFWIGYSFKDGYFGVPAGNFIGWLLVSFTWFYFEQKFNPKRLWLKYSFLPIISYLTFSLVFIFISLIESFLMLDKTEEFLLLGCFLIIFLSQVKKGEERKPVEKTVYLLRLPFYVFGLFFLIKQRMYEENVLLLLLSIIFTVVEIALIMGEIGVFAKKDNKRNLQVVK
jgi:putative membrane protein